jgi:hypothetical protein
MNPFSDEFNNHVGKVLRRDNRLPHKVAAKGF